MLSSRQSLVPELDGIREEGFVQYKALTQTSSWVSCDSNPFICSLSLPTRLLPNILIYAHMPIYATVLDCHKQENPKLFLVACGMKSSFLQPYHWYKCICTHKQAYSLCAHLNSNICKCIHRTCVHIWTEIPLQGPSIGSSCFCASPGCQCELERRLHCLL